MPCRRKQRCKAGRELRNGDLERMRAVVKRQQRVQPKGPGNGLLLDRERGRGQRRPHCATWLPFSG